MPDLAGHVNRSAMGFYDCLGDCQSHSCSMNLMALAWAAVKLVENKALFEHADPNAAIGYAHD